MLAAVLSLLLTGCDKLENGDTINEILPGMWGFSYETDEELDMTIEYDNVVFASDGTCTIGTGSEQLTGTYRASDAVIRIDYAYGSDERTMLWRVLQMSPYKIVAEYSFDYGQKNVTATVFLDRVGGS